MGLMFCDGFDSYGATADLLRKWGSNVGWTWNATAGRNGAGGITTTTTALLKTPLGSTAVGSNNPGNPIVAGFYIKATALPASDSRQVIFYDSSEVNAGSWGIRTTGVPAFWDSNGNLKVTGITNICDGSWHWVEWYFRSSTIGTTQICYVDSISNWNLSTDSWNNYIVDHTSFGTNVAVGTLNISWPIIYDNTAPAPSASSIPIGPRQITTIRPASDGTCTFATLSAGTNHSALVNEVNPDGDTSYVSDGTSGHQDLYNYSSIGYTPTNITTVMVNNYLKNPNAGSVNFQTACKSGATTGLGTSLITPSGYAIRMTSFPTDPNTSAAWTPTNLATAQFGIKVP